MPKYDQPLNTFWRIAGMTYLQYVSRATTAVRAVAKDPIQRKAMAQELYTLKKSTWVDGVQQPKQLMTTVKEV